MPFKVETGVKGRIDWAFLFAAAALVVCGTLAILSAASPMSYYLAIVRTHFIALFVGSMLFLFGLGFNYQIFQDQIKVVYAVVILLLIAVLVAGTTHKGHRSWLQFGPLNFQPSEMARIGTIFVMAAFLDARARKIRDFSTVVLGMCIAAPIMALIMKQPDFGSTMTFMPIMVGMMFAAGADAGHLLALSGFGLTALSMPLVFTYFQINFPQAQAGTIPYFILEMPRMGTATLGVIVLVALAGFGAWRLSVMLRMQAKALYFVAAPLIITAGILSGILINNQMKSYQRNRFVAFINPQADLHGASYHVHQSQIAIGSGGAWGKGLFSGTQSQLGFLPERHTDFIYAVIGEEMGFVGTMGILSLYLLMIWRIVSVGKVARDRFGFLVCSGVATMFAFELVLNVGMCLGLMPVTGIPLPLISYGGSSLVITLWALGVVANIYSRRYALL